MGRYHRYLAKLRFARILLCLLLIADYYIRFLPLSPVALVIYLIVDQVCCLILDAWARYRLRRLREKIWSCVYDFWHSKVDKEDMKLLTKRVDAAEKRLKLLYKSTAAKRNVVDLDALEYERGLASERS